MFASVLESRSRMRLLLVSLTVAAGLVVGPSALAGSGSGSPERALARAFPQQLERIASVRVYQTGHWTVPGENAGSVGRALASLKPTWLSSLIRYPKGMSPTGAEVAAWNKITAIVRAASPEAQFGIELNSLQYREASQVERMMSKIRARFDNDGWMFDFYTPGYRKYPEVVEAAIASAHDNGEWIGGNAFGITANPKIPPGSDFIAVQDFGFKINLVAVRRLAQQVPVVYHIGNNPQLANSDGCEWINEFTTAKRAAFLKHRASQQAAYNFHMAYPVLFPECERDPNAPNSDIFAYNAIDDTPMMETIGGLLNQSDPTPLTAVGSRGMPSTGGSNDH